MQGDQLMQHTICRTVGPMFHHVCPYTSVCNLSLKWWAGKAATLVLMCLALLCARILYSITSGLDWLTTSFFQEEWVSLRSRCGGCYSAFGARTLWNWFSEIWGMCMDRCGTCLSASTWRVSPGIKEVTDCGRQKWVWELVVHRVMFGQLQWLPSFLWFRCLSVQIFTWARRCEPDWHPGLPTGYTGLLLLTCQQFSSKT